MARGLTDAQERYVVELIKGNTQRVAYRIAYPSAIKWKDSAVDSKASTLLRNAKVRQRYDELTEQIANEIQEEGIVTVKEIIKELKRVAFADINDYLSYRTEKVIVGEDEDGNPIYGYRQVIELVESAKVDGKTVQEVSINSKGVFSFKLHSKMDALDKLGRHLKMFTDKVEQTVDSEIIVRMEGLEDLMK